MPAIEQCRVLEECRILIVEDDEPLRRVLLRALLVGGYQWSWAVGTLHECFHHLLQHDGADLVVMDVKLPNDDRYENGCAAGRAIVLQYPGTRLLFMSGWGAQLMERCEPHIPLLEKPVGVSEFLARVAEILTSPPWEPRRRRNDREE